MGFINVRRDVSDAFYRYKMESIITKIEGKGNGIKTVVVNLSSVAQALARPGSYLIKYFGFELGAQTNIDPQDDRWIINGAHEATKLQDLLDEFIKKFVLCKQCENPETEVNIKDGTITLDCKACGKQTVVDLRLKLSSFILKTVPKKSKRDKAERKAARKAKQNGNGQPKESGSGGEDNSDHGSHENGVEEGSGASDHEPTKLMPDIPDIEAIEVKNHEWTIDMSAEAIKARQAHLPSEFKQKLTFADDDLDDGEGGEPTAYDELGNWIQDQAAHLHGIDKVESISIYVKAKEFGIESKHRTVLVLVQTIFDENICAQIPKRASMLKQIISSDRHEKALLGGTERFIAAHAKGHPEMYQQIVKILQLYYHHDLLSEEVASKWGTRASKKYVDLAISKKVRKAAEPFITWLAEADEEESSDEE